MKFRDILIEFDARRQDDNEKMDITVLQWVIQATLEHLAEIEDTDDASPTA